MKRRDFLQSAAATAATYAVSALPTVARAAPDRIKVGQIGTKHAHASGKIATLRKFSEDYEIVGVAEPDEEQAKRAAAASGPYRDLPFMSAEQLLNTKGLQAVAIETEVRDLLKYAEMAVKAGFHIHLDKPAGEDLSHFARVLDEASRRKLTVQMGYMFRYNSAFELAYKAAREGWLGNVFEIHTVMSKKVGAGERRALSAYAGGSMFELGCHIIDSVVYILGKPDKVTAFTRRTFPDKDALADNQLAVLEYAKATATVRSSLIEYDGGRRRQFVVCGDDGVIDIKPLEPPKAQLTLSQARETFAKGSQEVTLPKMAGRYDGDFIDLAKVIRGEKAFAWSPKHDLAVQETVLLASGLLVDPPAP